MKERKDSITKMTQLNEIREIVGERVYESRLAELAREHPDNVFSWTVARDMSKDELMKHYFLEQMAECIRKNRDIMSYLKGIMYTHDKGKYALREKLINEMTTKHSILGRLAKLMFCLQNPLE